MKISLANHNIHLRALQLCRGHRRLESELILILQKIDAARFFTAMGHNSLFVYTTRALDLTDSVAYRFISVARKSLEIEALQLALTQQRLSVSKASRLVAAINLTNASALIEFAATHTCCEVEREVARLRPEAGRPDRAKILSDDLIHLEMSVSRSVHEKLKRVLDLRSGKSPGGFAGVLEAALDLYLWHRDPVQKAERASARTAEKEKVAADEPTQPLSARRVAKPNRARRVPLTAQQKHTVMARDGGRCTHIDESGQRCATTRWVELHHSRPVSDGGSNDPSNLVTLCSFHHDLKHQLTFAFEPVSVPATDGARIH